MVDTQAAADFVCNKSKSRACSFHSILSIRIMMNDFLYICKAYYYSHKMFLPLTSLKPFSDSEKMGR